MLRTIVRIHRWFRWALITASVLCALALMAADAIAQGTEPEQPPACPQAPDPYTGTDPLAEVLYEQLAADVAACQALADRLDRVESAIADLPDPRPADVIAAAESTRDAVQALRDGTEAEPVHVIPPEPDDAAAGTPEGTADAPLHVELAADSSQQLDDAARAIHGDLWLMLGAGAAVLFFLSFARTVTPWWR